VSEPIGLGISFHRALHAKAICSAKRWKKAGDWIEKSTIPPLARDLSAGRVFEEASKPSANAGPPVRWAGEAAKAVEAADLELCSGATLGAVSGVRSIRQLCSTIVLIAEVDKRRAVLATPGE
jgi:hypothetical protein